MQWWQGSSRFRFDRMGRGNWSLRFARREKILQADFLSEPVFEFDGAVGLFVAVLHDDRSVKRKIPFCGGAFFHGARAGDYYGIFRDFERRVGGGAVDLAANQVVERGRAGQNRAGTEDGAGSNQRAFVNSAISSYQHVVFDDHRRGVDGLQNPADL